MSLPTHMTLLCSASCWVESTYLLDSTMNQTLAASSPQQGIRPCQNGSIPRRAKKKNEISSKTIWKQGSTVFGGQGVKNICINWNWNWILCLCLVTFHTATTKTINYVDCYLELLKFAYLARISGTSLYYRLNLKVSACKLEIQQYLMNLLCIVSWS